MKICIIGFNHITVNLLETYKDNSVCITQNILHKDFEYEFVYDDYDNISKEFYSEYDIIIMSSYNHDNHYINIEKFTNLLNKINKQKLIYFSSAVVYVYHNKPVEYYTENSKRYTTTDYNIVKNKIDELVNSCEHKHKKIIGLCLGTVSGKSIIKKKKMSIINQIMDNYYCNNKINISDNLYKSIITLKDLYRVINTIINNNEINKGYYNISSFEINTHILNEALLKYNIDCEIYNDKIPNYNFYLNNKKFKDDFNFEFLDDINTHIKTFI